MIEPNDFLRENYLHMSNRDLADQTGLTVAAVISRLRNMRLRRRSFMEQPEPIAGERWRVIPETPAYEASSEGRIRERKRGHLVKSWMDRYGYCQIRLSVVTGVIKTFSVHVLVASAFHGEANGRTVNHKDGVKTNNRSGNLEYLTKAENHEHARINGLLRGPGSMVSEATARSICQLLQDGVRPAQIVRDMDVGLEVVRKIRRRATWKKVSSDYVW